MRMKPLAAFVACNAGSEYPFSPIVYTPPNYIKGRTLGRTLSYRKLELKYLAHYGTTMK